jgi:hypothetical protein
MDALLRYIRIRMVVWRWDGDLSYFKEMMAGDEKRTERDWNEMRRPHPSNLLSSFFILIKIT